MASGEQVSQEILMGMDLMWRGQPVEMRFRHRCSEPAPGLPGMAPRARIAMYKACWSFADESLDGCYGGDDTMAAIEQATADGVNVINYSIGGV